jgi:hypothetical protein
MRFFLIADIMTHYRARMLSSLAQGIIRAANEDHVIYVMSGHDRRLNDADVVLGIDIPRPEYLSPKIKYVAWIQDLISWPHGNQVPRQDNYEQSCRDGDIIYTLGDGRSVGIDEAGPHWRGSLGDAVDPGLFDRPRKHPFIDFSLCSYIPPPPGEGDIAGVNDSWRLVIEGLLRELYQPLCGSLDPLLMYEFIKVILLDRKPGNYDWETHLRTRSQEVKWIIIQYPRLLDRIAAAKLMLAVSEDTEIRGANWEWYPEVSKWCLPHTNDMEVLYNTYQKARVNLHVNITGFGIHSRVLECMALSCFVMSHTTPRQCAGQLTECFEPDVHYGVFTPEDFKERARYWLDNQEAREKASEEARKIVRAKHLWEHRGAAILKDLSQ